MNDEYLVRYATKKRYMRFITVYAKNMHEAKLKAEKEIGSNLDRITEISNCTFIRNALREGE